MSTYSLVHVTDDALLRDLTALITHERTTIASLLAHIAEVDARRLYVPAGYASMHAYCVEELRLSDDAAYKRIQAARAARRFPLLFEALAEGRLHLAAVCLLSPYLSPENVAELVEAATHRRKYDIETMLAQRFSVTEVPSNREGFSIRPVAAVLRVSGISGGGPPSSDVQLALGQGNEAAGSEEGGSGGKETEDGLPAEPRSEAQLAPGQVGGSPDGPALHAVERYRLQVMIGKDLHAKLRYAQALLSHSVPSGDMAQVLERALDTLISQLENRKLGAGIQRVAPRRASHGGRYIPIHVRRAIWERDGGQCTFVGTHGHRCKERRFLQFDHIKPYARGGRATVEGLRLRCRVHNQWEAERAFGADFMTRKREEARRAKEETSEQGTPTGGDGSQEAGTPNSTP